MLKTKDFYYDLPEELIAQTPVYPRDASRLLVYDREKDSVLHEHFYDLPKFSAKIYIISQKRMFLVRKLFPLRKFSTFFFS